MSRAWLACCLLLLQSHAGAAEATLRIAVAANFNGTLERLIEAYRERHPDFRAVVTSGASGKHYAQISQGAPFDLFFSADDQLTAALVAGGRELPDTRAVYALGTLVLWSPDPQRLAGDGAAWLRSGQWDRLAIANPRVAPYGAAALAVLQALEVPAEGGRLVTGQSLGQAFAFVSSGNAEAGFVALSQVIEHERGNAPGSRWLPAPALYPPIVQEAVVLAAASDAELAGRFLAWVLGDPAAAALIRADGYRTAGD